MAPKGVGKAVSKKCPHCNKQIPVATRICGCGHQFFEERRRSSSVIQEQRERVSSPDIEELPISRPQRSPEDSSNASVASNSIQEVIHNVSISGTGGSMMPSTSKANGAAAASDSGKRRSERVRREKPNFYDASSYDTPTASRKTRRVVKDESDRVNAIQSSRADGSNGRGKRERRRHNNSDEDDDEDMPIVKEKKRRKKKKKVKKEEEEQEEDDIMAGISPYREKSFAYVLADINMKLGFNNPRFIDIKPQQP